MGGKNDYGRLGAMKGCTGTREGPIDARRGGKRVPCMLKLLVLVPYFGEGKKGKERICKRLKRKKHVEEGGITDIFKHGG